MKPEDRELLLKDLCGRLPYGVKCKHNFSDYKEVLNGIKYENAFCYFIDCEPCLIEDIKPYLFPLSSMTEEQKRELEDIGWSFDDSVINNIVEYLGNHRQFVTHFDCFALIDWLDKNHFDYRGLIPKGRANDATNLNIY